jgi:hypothetical protein
MFEDETAGAASVASDMSEPGTSDELVLARELVLRAHPETVAELVTGGTLAELLASVPAAEAAYTRVATAARDAVRTTLAANPATVPGGGAIRSAPVNLDSLGPLAKIRAGLNQS